MRTKSFLLLLAKLLKLATITIWDLDAGRHLWWVATRRPLPFKFVTHVIGLHPAFIASALALLTGVT